MTLMIYEKKVSVQQNFKKMINGLNLYNKDFTLHIIFLKAFCSY